MAVACQIDSLSKELQAGPSVPVVNSINMVQEEDEICGFKFLSFASLDELETHITVECQTTSKEDSANLGQKRRLSQEEEVKDPKNAFEVKKKKRKPKKKADDVEIISENWSSRRRQTNRRSAYGSTGYGDYLPSQLIDFVLEIEASEQGQDMENWYCEEDFMFNHTMETNEILNSVTGVTTQSSARGENEGTSINSSELMLSDKTTAKSLPCVNNSFQEEKFHGKPTEVENNPKKKKVKKRKHVDDEVSVSSGSVSSSEHAAVKSDQKSEEKLKKETETNVKPKKIKTNKKAIENMKSVQNCEQKFSEIGITGSRKDPEFLEKKSVCKDIAIGVRPKKKRKKQKLSENDSRTQASTSVSAAENVGVSTEQGEPLLSECRENNNIGQNFDLNPDISNDTASKDLDKLSLDDQVMQENIDPIIETYIKPEPVVIKTESKMKPLPSSCYKKLKIANERGNIPKDTTSRTEGIDAFIRYRQKARKLSSPCEVRENSFLDFDDNVYSPIVEIERNSLTASVDAVKPSGEICIKEEKIDEEEFDFGNILSEIKKEQLEKLSGCGPCGGKQTSTIGKPDTDINGNISDDSDESCVVDVESIDNIVNLPPDCNLSISSFNPYSQRLPYFGHFSSYHELTKPGHVDVIIQTYSYDIDLHAHCTLYQPGRIFRAETINEGNSNPVEKKQPSLCKLHEWVDNQKILDSLKQYRSVTEKRRRKLLTNLFITLRNLVYPDICNLDIQFSKQSILTQSRKDIIALTAEEKKLISEKDKLLEINRELKAKLKGYLEEFRGTAFENTVELSCKEVLPLLDEELAFTVENEECLSKETDTTGLDEGKKDIKRDPKDTDMDLFVQKGLGEQKVQKPLKKEPRSSRKSKVVATNPDVLSNNFIDPCVAFDTAAILSLGLGAQETVVDHSALENAKKRHFELTSYQIPGDSLIPLAPAPLISTMKQDLVQELIETEQTNKRGIITCNFGRLYSNLNKNICFVMSKNTVKTLDSKDAKHITFDGTMVKEMGSNPLTVGGLSMMSKRYTVTDLTTYADKNMCRDIIQKEHDYTTKHLVFQ